MLLFPNHTLYQDKRLKPVIPSSAVQSIIDQIIQKAGGPQYVTKLELVRTALKAHHA